MPKRVYFLQLEYPIFTFSSDSIIMWYNLTNLVIDNSLIRKEKEDEKIDDEAKFLHSNAGIGCSDNKCE